jgi:hypothetical protein
MSELSFSMGIDQPTILRTVEPNEEALRSYLLSFRRFISPGEPLFIGQIHNLCLRHFTSDKLRSCITECRQTWKEHVLRNGIKLIINGHSLLPEYVADLWINGHYFHDDPQKGAELQRFVPLERIFVRRAFIDFVIEATRVIGYSGLVVKMALTDGSISE